MMIYDTRAIPFQYGIFEIDIDEDFMKIKGFTEHTSKPYLKMWLNRQKPRIYLRCFVFIDTVLKWGFLDPLLIWANLKTGTMRVHPGTNRYILHSILPERPMIGWVVDSNCKSHQEYKKVFPSARPLIRDERGDRNMFWRVDHRTRKGYEDQYELSLGSDQLLGEDHMDTQARRDRWAFLSDTKGFGCWLGGKKYYDIGNAREEDQYEILRVAGIYQLFLQCYFDYPESKWGTKFYRRMQ